MPKFTAPSCALLLLLTIGCSKKEQANPMAMMMEPAPVRAVAAVRTDVPLEVSAVGNVESMATVDVKSRVAGEVMRVAFQEGQTVAKGQLLFEIDPEPLRRQIAQIQADLVRDRALEAQARANAARDQAQLVQSQSSAERSVQLLKEGIFSKEQSEQVTATHDAAQASVAADRAAIDSASAAIKSDEARLAQTELQMTYTKITAPIDGRAGAINVKAGNLIKENDAALVTLLQMSPIYISFGLPEQLLPDVRKFNAEHPLQVSATAQSGGIETGALKFIDNAVDMTTGTIKIKAEFSNADKTFWPGEFVNVQARLNVEQDKVVIPSRAVQTGPQGKYVWLLNPADNTVAMRPVEVSRLFKGDKGAETSVIGGGLKPGEMVISEGQLRLMPGGKVRLLKRDGEVGASETAAGAGPS